MLDHFSRRLRWVLAATFAFFAAQSAIADTRADPCDGPSNRRPVAELLPLAEAGDAEAQYRLGYKYRFGEGAKMDSRRAAKWMRRAADQGHVAATGTLGVMHLQGSDVPKDIDKGLRLMRRAASKGCVCTQAGLGFNFMMGYFGVSQDLAEAEKWLRMAAEAEYYGPQRWLAEMHSGRFGSEADLVKSLRWAIIAKEFDPDASGLNLIGELRDKILPKMSPEEIAEAERRAQAWLARHGK